MDINHPKIQQFVQQTAVSKIFDFAAGTYSIDSSTIPTIYLAACVANAALDTAILGTHDLQVDTNF